MHVRSNRYLRRAMCFEWKRHKAKLPKAQRHEHQWCTEVKRPTHHIPQARNTQIAPTTIQLSFRIKPPDWRTFVGYLVTTYTLNMFFNVVVAEIGLNSVRDQKQADKVYPVAKTMTSAERWLPSSNRRPVSVNSLIWLSFFSFILPSAISWLAPTSGYDTKLVIQR